MAVMTSLQPSQAVAIDSTCENDSVCLAVSQRLRRAISDGASYGVISAELGIPKATIYDYTHERRKPTISRAARILSWRYHRDSPHYALTHPCPTCGQVHAVDDCHGKPGVVVWQEARPRQPARPRPPRARLEVTDLVRATRSGHITLSEAVAETERRSIRLLRLEEIK